MGGGECKIGMEVIWEGDGGGKKLIYNFFFFMLDVFLDVVSFELDMLGFIIFYLLNGSVVFCVKNLLIGVISVF